MVASYSGESFDKVANAQVRLVNEADQKEMAKYELSTGSEFAGKYGVELGRLVRNGSEWGFKATGIAVEGGDFNAVVRTLGIN